MSRFQPIVDELLRTAPSTPSCWGPRGYHDYCDEHGISPGSTAYHLSVQSVGQLADELRTARAMIFRLGSVPNGRKTQFAVVRLPDEGIEGFFFDDEDLFGTSAPKQFTPKCSPERLQVFRILGALTEQSTIRMGFQAGLFSQALQLDDKERLIVPASGNSSYTFEMRPHPAISTAFTHRRGQVEIDGLFIAKREGQRLLFVLEGKKSNNFGTLPKHKLAYPIWAVAARVPDSIDAIVPIYVRMSQTDSGIDYHIAECAPVEPETMTVSGLQAVRSTTWKLEVG